jgi:antirestriction protein ArdC
MGKRINSKTRLTGIPELEPTRRLQWDPAEKSGEAVKGVAGEDRTFPKRRRLLSRSEGYARKELRAEIASMIRGSELGIGYDKRFA